MEVPAFSGTKLTFTSFQMHSLRQLRVSVSDTRQALSIISYKGINKVSATLGVIYFTCYQNSIDPMVNSGFVFLEKFTGFVIFLF